MNDAAKPDWPAAPAPEDLIRVSSSKVTFPGSMETAQAQFSAFRAIHVANIFQPDMLQTVLRLCDSSEFGPEEQTPGFREIELSPQRAGRVITHVLHHTELLRWLEEATRCGPLANIQGRLSRTLNRPGDQLLWHDDQPQAEARRLAMVIYLSTEPYEGGNFQLRYKSGKQPLFAHHYQQLGSALIFQVHPSLEHRVLPLRSGSPRRVFAGWAYASEAQ